MKNEDLFEKRIKEIADSYEVQPDEGVWEGIEKGLSAKRRNALIRRVAYISSVAAAMVTGLIFITMREEIPERDMLSENGEIRSEEKISVIERGVTGSMAQVTVGKTEQETGSADPKEISYMEMPLHEEAETFSEEAEDDRDGETVTSEGRDVAEFSAAEEEQKTEQEDEVNEEPVIMTEKERVAYNTYMTEEEEEDDDAVRSGFSLAASGDLSVLGASSGLKMDRGNYFTFGNGGVNSMQTISPISKPSHFMPISAGIELQYSFLKERMAVGLGVTYTYLFSKYEALIDKSFQGVVEQEVHYIGVPLNLYFNIISNRKIVFYASIGGMLERALSSSCKITDLYNDVSHRTESVSGVQWSANVGIGFEYRFIRTMGIFFDPKLTYFFSDSDQPFSVRTEQPLQMSLQLGFRFHF